MSSFYLQDGDGPAATFLNQGFHHGPVTGLSMANHRPLCASSGKDGSVRLWNFANKGCELGHVFVGDIPEACAVHPNGYMMAVSFTEKLRIFNVLVSELRVYREFSVRGARHLTFSPGGNLLACALQKVIVVYDAMFIHSKLERICSNFI